MDRNNIKEEQEEVELTGKDVYNLGVDATPTFSVNLGQTKSATSASCISVSGPAAAAATVGAEQKNQRAQQVDGTQADKRSSKSASSRGFTPASVNSNTMITTYFAVGDIVVYTHNDNKK